MKSYVELLKTTINKLFKADKKIKVIAPAYSGILKSIIDGNTQLVLIKDLSLTYIHKLHILLM